MTKLFKQEEVDKAANDYENSISGEGRLIRGGFKAGVKFTESKVEEIAVEFADWILKNDYSKIHGDRWVKLYMSRTESSKELFQQFIKERNE